jgi:DNA-binding MarR family transcriptional regulator
LEALRFEKFTLLIDGIHKSIGKIKHRIVPTLGIKSVHVLWLYQLMARPDGMTAAEIAAASMIDRSLVSREIEPLVSDGYVARVKSRRYTLTEKGKELSSTISEMVKGIQAKIDEGITLEELLLFYSVLERINKNLAAVTESSAPKRKRTAKRREGEAK